MHILELPSNDPRDPKLLAKVRATGPELLAQPAAICETLQINAAMLDGIADRLASGIDRVVMVGCGDSLAVMIAARQALEAMLAVPCQPMQSLEFAYYHAGRADARTAVIALSSSGETTRTVEALLMAQHRGSYTVALTNTAGSTLQTEADTALLVGATRLGWPTQSSTSALALLLELAIRVGERRVPVDAALMRQAFDRLPGVMAHELLTLDPMFSTIAGIEVAVGVQTALFAGAGPNFASAIVGAAKVKECTTLHAIEIQTEEYHHYNSQKTGEPLFLFAPAGPSVPRAVDTGIDALRWGGRLYIVTTEGVRAFDGLADDRECQIIALPDIPEPLTPLLYFLPAQLTGYHLGLTCYAAASAHA